MSKIQTVILEGDKFYVKRNTFFEGYRVVHPIKDEEGHYIIPNLLFGGWSNLFKLIIILALMFFLMWSYNHDTAVCRQLIANQSAMQIKPVMDLPWDLNINQTGMGIIPVEGT